MNNNNNMVRSNEQTQELKSLISVLRAIVLSRKQPCSMLSVMKDYAELESRPLPFKKFGFTNPLDFFIQSGEFQVRQMRDEAFIATKSNDKSSHIATLVRQQKSTGRTPHIEKVVIPPRRRVRPNNFVQGRLPPGPRKNQQTFSNQAQVFEQQQHQILLKQKQEIQLQCQKQLQEQLDNELAKQKKQLQLKFEKEKEVLREELLAELKSKKLKEKNDANNKCSSNGKCIESYEEITRELKRLKDVYELINNAGMKWNERELEETHEICSGLKRITKLIADTENKEVFANMFKKSEEIKRNKGEAQAQGQAQAQAQIQNQTRAQSQSKSLVSSTASSASSVSTKAQASSISKKTQPNTSTKTATIHGNTTQNHTSNSSVLPPSDLRHRINAKRSQGGEASSTTNSIGETKLQNENPNLRPILGQQNNGGNVNKNNIGINNNNNNNNCNNNNSRDTKNLQLTKPQPIKAAAESLIKQDISQQQQPQQKINRNLTRFPSVQNRLKLNINCDTNANGTTHPNPLSATTPVPQRDVPSSIHYKTGEALQPNSKPPNTLTLSTNRKIWKFDPQWDPCTSIAAYCSAKNYGEPQYKLFKSKRGLFNCQLIINSNTIYSTYPQEHTTEMKARLACAEKAIQQIQIVEERNLLPTFPNENDFLDVLYNALLQHPNGIISDKMSEWFVDKFQYLLPDQWFMLIKNSKRFTIENGIRESTFIILANTESPNNDYGSNIDHSPTEITPVKMESLKFPWSKKAWELHIKHCVSTVEIWASLFGTEYYERFDTLMQELNNEMIKKKTRPDVIAPKHIYLVEANSCWHRVRVESLDKEKQKTLCFYIDFGSTEYLAVNELYLCEEKFLCLPPQAVPFSLFGLEDLVGHPNAIQFLKERLLDKAVIGEVVTKKAEFENKGIIQLVMFDTLTEEDINLNSLLQQEICKYSKLPKLRSEGTNTVNITNIDNSNGDISLLIVNDDSEYVLKTLKHMVETKLNSETHKCSPIELLRPQMLLVHDVNHSIEWYRAKVIDFHQIRNVINGQDEMIDVIYIDHNVRRRVNISKIYRLESLSCALSKFPPQAMRVKLHNIPEFSQNIIGRMRALLPENCQAFARVEKLGEVPFVTILRKVNGPEMPFCNINDDLRLEIETTKDATLCLKDSSYGSASSIPELIQSPTQLFSTLTLNSAPMLPLKISELPKLREYDVNLPLNSTFFVNVILVSNPLSFTVQPYNGDFERLLKMMKQLQDYCVNNDAFIPADMVEVGQAYAAKKEDAYYRVIARTCYTDMINVSFCDYGDSGTIRSDHLKVLPAQFRQLPIMGINARIYGLKAKTDYVWSKDDVKRFSDLVLGKHMASFIKGIRRDEKGSVELSLDLVDVQGEDDVNIRQVLINEKRASPQEHPNE